MTKAKSAACSQKPRQRTSVTRGSKMVREYPRRSSEKLEPGDHRPLPRRYIVPLRYLWVDESRVTRAGVAFAVVQGRYPDQAVSNNSSITPTPHPRGWVAALRKKRWPLLRDQQAGSRNVMPPAMDLQQTIKRESALYLCIVLQFHHEGLLGNKLPHLAKIREYGQDQPNTDSGQEGYVSFHCPAR
jgi:hypothetical protein